MKYYRKMIMGVSIFIIYCLGLGSGMYILNHRFGIEFENPIFISGFLIVQAVIGAVVIPVYILFYSEEKNEEINYNAKSFVIYILMCLIMLFASYFVFGYRGSNVVLLLPITAIAVIKSISEEIVFRRLVIQWVCFENLKIAYKTSFILSVLINGMFYLAGLGIWGILFFTFMYAILNLLLLTLQMKQINTLVKVGVSIIWNFVLFWFMYSGLSLAIIVGVMSLFIPINFYLLYKTIYPKN